MSQTPAPDTTDATPAGDEPYACVLTFNANDPSGAAGLAADISSISCVGAHALPVACGVYLRDTAQIHDHIALDDDALTEQARMILEDVPVQTFKVGFVGTPENLGAVAALASDYSDVPVVAYMPDLSWWETAHIERYQDACTELLLPVTTVLVGNHSTLRRWLLPEWSGLQQPTARDIARAAEGLGVPYTLVTGIALPDQYTENTLCTANTVLLSQKFERLDGTFVGAGDTLSAALATLLAMGVELGEAATEALRYLDQCLEHGFRPGMGHVLPDRMFWAHLEDDAEDETAQADSTPEANTPGNPTALH